MRTPKFRVNEDFLTAQASVKTANKIRTDPNFETNDGKWRKLATQHRRSKFEEAMRQHLGFP